MRSPDRPYFFDTTADLKRRVDSQWYSPAILHSIYAELLFRKRKKAKQLRDRIAVRLNDFEQYFAWPTTDVTQGAGGIDPSVYRVGQGTLGFLGYRVGAAGISTLNRRALLDYVYENSLPTVDSIEYMEQWGKPRSATRLKKVANVLAALVRGAKRNNPDTYAVGHCSVVFRS